MAKSAFASFLPSVLDMEIVSTMPSVKDMESVEPPTYSDDAAVDCEMFISEFGDDGSAAHKRPVLPRLHS